MRIQTALAITTLAFSWLLTSAAALASGPNSTVTVFNQSEAAKQLADKVASVLGTHREVYVGEFRGFSEHHVGLSKLVGDALASNHNIEIRRGADVEVDGRLFRFPKNDKQPLEGFTISATVLLPNGERRFSFDVENRDEGHIATGKSGEKIAPPNKTHGSLASNDGPFLDGHVVRPSKTSPFGVEFLRETRGHYEPLTPHLDGLNISLQVRKGDLIACRLHNTSGFEAAANVLVDGLSRFALASDPARKGCVDLVAHGKPRTIIGYFRDTQRVDAFRIGEYSKSVAAELMPEATERGTFTIAFRAAWESGKQPPPNERGFTGRSVGIELGPQREDRTRQVQRNIGGVRAIVKVFYGD